MIRLRRMGARKDPHYRVVVTDSHQRPRGRFVETVGTYDPGTDPATIRMDLSRVEEWIRKGARPSETVKSLIEKAKVPQT